MTPSELSKMPLSKLQREVRDLCHSITQNQNSPNMLQLLAVKLSVFAGELNGRMKRCVNAIESLAEDIDFTL